MKFHQLKIGEPFTYQGKRYSKLNNLLAREEESEKQVLIQRSAEVEPSVQGEHPVEEKTGPQKQILARALNDLQMASIKQFESYQQGVSLDLIKAEIDQIRKEIQQHYEKLLD